MDEPRRRWNHKPREQFCRDHAIDFADLTQSQRVSARIIATQIRRGHALSIRSRRAKVRTAH